jgi:hypothetical protein
VAAPVAQTGAGNVTTGSNASATSVTANKPANVVDGDVLVAGFYHRNARADTSTITVPSGWNPLGSINVVDETFGMYFKPIPSASGESATSYTWSVTSGGNGRTLLAICRVTGVKLSAPQDAAGAQAAHTGTSSVTDPAVTAMSDQALLFAINITHRSDGTAALLTPPVGMTEVTSVQVTNTGPSTSVMQLAQEPLSAAGSTGARVLTISPAAANSGGYMVTLAPPASGAATLTSTSSMSASATVGYAAAATLSSTSSMTATAGGQNFTAEATLSSTSSMSATAASDPVSVLVDGVWRKVTVYELVNGSWVQS